ncbi:hypothetical protein PAPPERLAPAPP_01720 [Brevundimonas phage vB_BpoS-Papperlapapp]|uniref:Uncharacterized protein n=2 Tax=Marchewkavirus TaxID=3425052 RepID=A0A9E7MNB7_9CAUD|nr:hypothetical protein KABACHOK_00090 [Brevundimonas phage vB_BpoS-Kabachok]USN14543.1 hypothetical protein DOMOVOI_00680 [Brevundimonas phage vB_BpoS-Domovoi]USN15914.1 hypothetical protein PAPPERLAPAPP_01720 [Brevundimonas phage vB_BpoS-Papperlapapp]
MVRVDAMAADATLTPAQVAVVVDAAFALRTAYDLLNLADARSRAVAANLHAIVERKFAEQGFRPS